MTTPSTTLSEKPPAPGPIFACDGQGLKALAAAALAWLERNQHAVNALNVFPVPDGDTGTNMLLTMRSAYNEIAQSAEASASAVAHRLAHGALMGARGNSGVILSQIWRGFARGVDGLAAFSARELAAGLREGSTTAYKGVVKPVEGTILTVSREIAEEAEQAADLSADMRHVLDRVVARGRESVAHTPELLPVLKEAGVVDAGGEGLACIFEGMLRYLRGERLEAAAVAAEPQGLQSALAPEAIGYGYDVQFILTGRGLDLDRVRADISAMGESTLVVGDANAIKVHVHVHDPGIPLSYGARHGVLADVVVEDMQQQYRQFVTNRLAPQAAASTSGRAAAAAEPAPIDRLPPPATVRPNQVGVVVVTAGMGLARVFASLGAAGFVSGGQTMNPSTEDILRVIGSVPAQHIVVLPNNKNIVLAAQQARELTDKRVEVVPTHNTPEGIAAMLAYNPDASLEDNAASMGTASQGVQCGEITTATRTVELDGVAVTQGQIIGLHNGRVAVAGTDVNAVVESMLEKMGAAGAEIITLYYGAPVAAAEAEALAARLRERYADHQVEVVEGGQPHYHYILSAE